MCSLESLIRIPYSSILFTGDKDANHFFKAPKPIISRNFGRLCGYTLMNV